MPCFIHILRQKKNNFLKILHTPTFCIQGVSKARNSMKKVSVVGNQRFSRYLMSKSMNSYRRNVKKFNVFLTLCLWEFIDFDAQIRLGQFSLGQVMLGYFRSGQVRLGLVRLGQVRFGQVRLGQVRLGQVRSGQVRLGQVRLGQVRYIYIIRAGGQEIFSFFHFWHI